MERVCWGLVSEVRAGLSTLESWYQAWKWEVFLLCVLGGKSKKRIFTKTFHFFGANLSQVFVRMNKEPLHLIQNNWKVHDFKSYHTINWFSMSQISKMYASWNTQSSKVVIHSFIKSSICSVTHSLNNLFLNVKMHSRWMVNIQN